MFKLNNHIETLYPNHAPETLSGIHELMTHYTGLIEKKPLEFTQKDAIFITYGDSFTASEAVPLQSLHKVAGKHLTGLVNSLHLLPFFPFTSDDGFSVVDYKAVNPEFGDWSDIKSLGQDFDLMFDAVINHMSKASDWFQQYLKGDASFQHFFIEENPENPALKLVVRPRTWPLLHPFNKQGKKTYIWTTFSEDQVDLNYSNPLVFLRILDILLFYVSQGSRYIRLDAIAFLWKKLGTDCLHLKETHLVIQLYRSIIEHVAPQTILITETNVPHLENLSYFGNGKNEAHMVYNFSLPPLLAYSLHAEDVDVLTQWAQTLKVPSNQTCFFNFTASHDGIGVRPLQGIVEKKQISKLAAKTILHGGFVSYKANPDGSNSPYELNCNYMDLLTHPEEAKENRVKRFMLTQSVMLCFPGIPGIYYHSVFGSENDREGALSSGMNRRINRQKIDIEILEKELNDKQNIRSLIYNEFRNLLQVRKEHPCFHPSSKTTYINDNNLFIIERMYEGEKIICLHNFSGNPQCIDKYLENAINLTHWKKANSVLNPFDFLWLKMKSKN